MSNKIKTIVKNTPNATKVSKEVTIKCAQYSYIITINWTRHFGFDNKVYNLKTSYNARFAHNNKGCTSWNISKKHLLAQLDIYENKAPKGMFL